jgi:hypothetical protein
MAVPHPVQRTTMNVFQVGSQLYLNLNTAQAHAKIAKVAVTRVSVPAKIINGKVIPEVGVAIL